MWPALWMDEVSGNLAAELDILEMLGNAPTTIYETNHLWPSDGGPGTQVHQCTFKGPDFSADFHVFGLQLQATQITWYVDGAQTCTTTQGVNVNPVFLMLNTAVGGVGSVARTTRPDYGLSQLHGHRLRADLPGGTWGSGSSAFGRGTRTGLAGRRPMTAESRESPSTRASTRGPRRDGRRPSSREGLGAARGPKRDGFPSTEWSGRGPSEGPSRSTGRAPQWRPRHLVRRVARTSRGSSSTRSGEVAS